MSALLQFMNRNDFSQHVYNATTDRGTMIDDLVFARNLDFVIHAIDTYDVYYSDHDAYSRI